MDYGSEKMEINITGKTLAAGMLASALLLLPAGPLSADDAAAAGDHVTKAELAGIMEAGRIKSADGKVTIIRNGEELPARNGTPVMAADRIITGEKSGAALFLRDNTAITLGPESSLDLSMFEFNPAEDSFGLLARMKYGTFSWVSGLLAKLAPETIKVQTPSATIGIRGTRFLVYIPAAD